jgi:hypothetical protein
VSNPAPVPPPPNNFYTREIELGGGRRTDARNVGKFDHGFGSLGQRKALPSKDPRLVKEADVRSENPYPPT